MSVLFTRQPERANVASCSHLLIHLSVLTQGISQHSCALSCGSASSEGDVISGEVVKTASYQQQWKIPTGGKAFVKTMEIYCADRDVSNIGFSSGKEEMDRSQVD